MELTNLGEIKEILSQNGITVKKKYGQNFLTNKNIVERIAAEGVRSENDGIIEIGPGIGVLTRELCKIAKKVVAIEIDSQLIPVLQHTLADFDNVSVINEDVLKLNLHRVIEEHFSDCACVRVCANLPYYITTPILMSLIESELPIASITVMVQKEVADRLCSGNTEGDYGAVSAAIAYYGCAKKLFSVAPGNFYPAPNVTSCVMRIDLYETKPITAKNTKMLSRVIRGAFAQRRKTLVNSLMSEFPNFTKAELTDLLKQLGFGENIRGEKLAIADFVRLSDAIETYK